MSRAGYSPWVCKILDTTEHLSLSLLGFPDISVGEESACNVRDLGSIPGSGRSTGEGNRYPLQLSGLENSMDCMVCEVTNSQTRLSDFHFKNKDHEAEFI